MKRPGESQEHDTPSTFLRMLGSSQFVISASLLISVHSLTKSSQFSVGLKPNPFQSGVRVDAVSPPGMWGHRLRKIHALRRNAYTHLYRSVPETSQAGPP